MLLVCAAPSVCSRHMAHSADQLLGNATLLSTVVEDHQTALQTVVFKMALHAAKVLATVTLELVPQWTVDANIFTAPVSCSIDWL